MVKRIIFDVDDTLIPWSRDYFKKLRIILKENKIKINRYRFYKLLIAINNYENSHDKWNMKEFVDSISKKIKIEMNEERTKLIINWLENCVNGKASQELKDTLEYLSKKYELVVLSNSFKEVQEKRLAKYGIKKYFKEIYGGDEVMKPKKEAYLKACGSYKPNECVMIGDNLEYDVIGPHNLGIKAIYLNKKINHLYDTINKIEKLKEIL